MAFIRASKQGIFTFATAILLLLAPHGARAKAETTANDSDNAPAVQELPSSNSQLPLLAFLGLGMLSGGLLSVRRTRPRKHATG